MQTSPGRRLWLSLCVPSSPHRVSNSGSSTRLAAGVPSQDNWFDGVVKAWNDSHEVKIQLVYVPNSAYMDGTKLPTAFASGTVLYPRVASYSVLSRTPLAKAIIHPPRPSPTCSSRSTISSALYSPFRICRLIPLTLTSCSRASAGSLGTTSRILTFPFATWPAKQEFHLRYLQKLFTARGTTCSRFIQSLRLDHAARLLSRRKLAKSDQPLSEIAYACGFRDYAHFSRTFHFRFGCTPSAASEGHISGNVLMRDICRRKEIA